LYQILDQKRGYAVARAWRSRIDVFDESHKLVPTESVYKIL
jgi:hypothetical protein